MSKRLYDILKDCSKEIEVQQKFINFFKIDIKALGNIDNYTPQVLYEFKLNRNFMNNMDCCKTIAQIVYYLHDLKYGDYLEPVSFCFCGASKHTTFIGKSSEYAEWYDSSKYDWDRAASSPDEKLVKDISEKLQKDSTKNKRKYNIRVYDISNKELEDSFINELKSVKSQTSLFDNADFCKKKITSSNFITIFDLWCKNFKHSIDENKHTIQDYFLADIYTGNIYNDKVLLQFLNNTFEQINIPIKKYREFWNMFEKIKTQDICNLRQFGDRLIEEGRRRFEGAFYTPISFANKGLEYLEKVIGKEWWKSGEYRFWDMACGTGNLEFTLPSDALQYCYLSTLDNDEVSYLNQIYPSATCFQYDYLNDDIQDGKIEYSKLPQKLQDDLKNPDLKWIVFINPPWATSNNKDTADGVSMTKIRDMMASDDLKEASRDIFIQFLYRIGKELPSKTILCMYSTIKYINSNNEQKIRDKFFDYTFKKGFTFSISNFYQASGRFLCAFAIWDMNAHKKIETQKIILDYFDNKVKKLGQKRILAETKDSLLNKWFKRPKCSIMFPPFKSAIQDGFDNVDKRNRICDNFICSIQSKGNDMQNQKYWTILSAPNVSAGAYSVNPEIFEKAMIAHCIRCLPKPTPYNNKDLFRQPTDINDPSFVLDCVVYNAFSNSNNTASLKDVVYQGNTYQITNHLYPFMLDEIKKWVCNGDICFNLSSANQDRFLAKYLKANKSHLSSEARDVLNCGKELYKFFYENFPQIDSRKYKIDNWDVGFWQIRMAIQDAYGETEEIKNLNTAHKKLHDKLLPKVYEYGFLDTEIELFD